MCHGAPGAEQRQQAYNSTANDPAVSVAQQIPATLLNN